MRRVLSSILCLALIITCAIALTACAKEETEYNKVAGTYGLTSVTIGESTTTRETVAERARSGFDATQIEVKADKTFKFTRPNSSTGEMETIEGTYKLDGKKITITSDDNTYNATIDGNVITLTLTEDGETGTYIFTKK